MSFSKIVLVAALACVSAVASAQQNRPQKVAMPCRLKPAIYTTLNGVQDYGVALIMGTQPLNTGPMSINNGAIVYKHQLDKGNCKPPHQLLICNVHNGLARRSIQFTFMPSQAFPQGHTEEIMNDAVGGTDPYAALTAYRQLKICR